MLVLACITSHGFGHGARVAALLQELAAREPACRFVLSTGLSAEFLSRTFVGPVSSTHLRAHETS